MRRDAEGEANQVLSPDFADFLMCLDEERVAFVLVGAFALGVHGVVRATGDLDVLYRPTRPNVRRLCTALRSFGAPAEVIEEEELLTPDIVTQFGRPPHRIDLMNTISGVTLAEVWNGAITVPIGSLSVQVLGLRELRKNKRASGRPKDLSDLRRLDALR